MRTSKEVKDELDDIKRNFKTTDGTEDIIAGWIEALDWVLSEYKDDNETFNRAGEAYKNYMEQEYPI